MSRLYIGNLPFDVRENDVKTLLQTYDPAIHVTLIIDRETGRGRGFGFVEIQDQRCQEAITELNGTAFHGRRMQVEAAKMPCAKRARSGSEPRPRITHRRTLDASVRRESRTPLRIGDKTDRTLSIAD